uniref:Uncharacterized protein n=1 Tax=Chenopodium quinoa TaxID=63459 RepID=A0A803MVJ7_CHEQI
MQNCIYSIKSADGNWVDNPQEVLGAFLEFYDRLLGTAARSRTEVNAAVVRKGQVYYSQYHGVPGSSEALQLIKKQLPEF